MIRNQSNEKEKKWVYDVEWSDELISKSSTNKIQQAIQNMYSQIGSLSKGETEEEE